MVGNAPLAHGVREFEVSVSDQSQLRALRDWLHGVPAVSVTLDQAFRVRVSKERSIT